MSKPTGQPNGRPSKYTEEIADRFFSGLADGKSMKTVCSPDDMPSTQTMFSWMRTKEGFLDKYTRAKEESADALADEMLDIADDGTNDYYLSKDDQPIVDGDHIQRSRLRIETRKWLASKLKPKKYGDRIIQEQIHSGYIGLKDISKMTDDELQNEIDADG